MFLYVCRLRQEKIFSVFCIHVLLKPANRRKRKEGKALRKAVINKCLVFLLYNYFNELLKESGDEQQK